MEHILASPPSLIVDFLPYVLPFVLIWPLVSILRGWWREFVNRGRHTPDAH